MMYSKGNEEELLLKKTVANHAFTSQQRLPTGTLCLITPNLKHYTQRPARAETLLRSDMQLGKVRMGIYA